MRIFGAAQSAETEQPRIGWSNHVVVVVLRGDGADIESLRTAGAMRAAAIVSTMRRLDDNFRLLRTLNGPRMLVRVFSEQEAERIRELGGHPLVEDDVATHVLLEWYVNNSSARGDDESRPRTGVTAQSTP